MQYITFGRAALALIETIPKTDVSDVAPVGAVAHDKIICVDLGEAGIPHRKWHDPDAKAKQMRPNQPMNPTAPWRDNFSVLATTPCRGLSLSR